MQFATLSVMGNPERTRLAVPVGLQGEAPLQQDAALHARWGSILELFLISFYMRTRIDEMSQLSDLVALLEPRCSSNGGKMPW